MVTYLTKVLFYEPHQHVLIVTFYKKLILAFKSTHAICHNVANHTTNVYIIFSKQRAENLVKNKINAYIFPYI